MPAPIESVEEFYAHALAIEREAADRYHEFAEYFERRGEDALAGLCRNLSGAERDHFETLARGCASMALPAIPADKYQWLEGTSPEAPARGLLYSIVQPRQLLQIALDAECRARDFFVWIARTSPSRAVKELAAIMAAEELDHVAWVRQALEYHGESIDWDRLIREGLGPGRLVE